MTTWHPELKRAAFWLFRDPGAVGLWVLRRLPTAASKVPAGVTVEELALPGGHASVRIIRASARRAGQPVLLWIHGGGYVLGAARGDDRLCAAFAQRLDAVVVSVDYRLAPAHPYPAPLDDCFAAFEFVHANATALGVDSLKLVIGGASAGGGLAAALTLRVFDAQRPAPKLSLLVYPMLDDRTATRDFTGFEHRVWGPVANRTGWAAYLGHAPGGTDEPAHAAPARRVDVSGLPPTWVGVGTRDLFFDEDVAYARRLEAAGVSTTLEVVDGAFHGFDTLLPDAGVSRAFFDAQVRAITAAF